MIWPGGNPSVGEPDADRAIEWVASGRFPNSTNLNYDLYHFAGVRTDNGDNRAYVYFGGCVPDREPAGAVELLQLRRRGGLERLEGPALQHHELGHAPAVAAEHHEAGALPDPCGLCGQLRGKQHLGDRRAPARHLRPDHRHQHGAERRRRHAVVRAPAHRPRDGAAEHPGGLPDWSHQPAVLGDRRRRRERHHHRRLAHQGDLRRLPQPDRPRQRHRLLRRLAGPHRGRPAEHEHPRPDQRQRRCRPGRGRQPDRDHRRRQQRLLRLRERHRGRREHGRAARHLHQPAHALHLLGRCASPGTWVP